MLALILQKPFEQAPPSVEHGLSHPCLRQLQAAHVAYHNVLIPINDGSAELMERIGSTACRPSVQTLRLTPMTASLRLGDPYLQSTVKATALQALTLAGDGDVLQSQVDADGLLGGRGRFSGVFHR